MICPTCHQWTTDQEVAIRRRERRFIADTLALHIKAGDVDTLHDALTTLEASGDVPPSSASIFLRFVDQFAATCAEASDELHKMAKADRRRKRMGL